MFFLSAFSSSIQVPVIKIDMDAVSSISNCAVRCTVSQIITPIGVFSVVWSFEV